jgi:hypothetical protein
MTYHIDAYIFVIHKYNTNNNTPLYKEHHIKPKVIWDHNFECLFLVYQIFEKVKILCGGPILANVKFTDEHTNLAIFLLILSQFQTLVLGLPLKVHSFFLNDSIILMYILYLSTIMININVKFFFHFYFFRIIFMHEFFLVWCSCFKPYWMRSLVSCHSSHW